MVNKKAKRIGRPRKPGGRDPVIALRLPKNALQALDWRAEQDGVTRSKAAAKLLVRALGIASKG